MPTFFYWCREIGSKEKSSNDFTMDQKLELVFWIWDLDWDIIARVEMLGKAYKIQQNPEWYY